MSGNDERDTVNDNLRKNYYVPKYGPKRREIRRHTLARNDQHDIGKETRNLKILSILVAVCISTALFSLLFTPIENNYTVTEVTASGDFDKIDVTYRPGDIMVDFVAMDEINETYIVAPQYIDFYGRPYEFYITVYFNGVAQPSERFVLSASFMHTVSCDNNITVIFNFDAKLFMVQPLYKVPLGLISVIILIGVVFLLDVKYIG